MRGAGIAFLDRVPEELNCDSAGSSNYIIYYKRFVRRMKLAAMFGSGVAAWRNQVAAQ